MIEPQFLKELADDAASIAHVRRVDRQLVLATKLLVLTHFAGNLIHDRDGVPLRVARNTMLISNRSTCPLWLKPIVACLHSLKNEDQDDDGFVNGLISSGLVQQLEDDDDDVVQEMLRRANPAPFPLPSFLEHGLGFSPGMGRYLVTHADGPCLGPGMAEDGAVVLVEGSRHLRALYGAREQHNALWANLGAKARRGLSVFGWCERNDTAIADMQFPGMPLLMGVPYGGGLRMNTVFENDGVHHHRNVFYDEGRNLRAFTRLLNHLLKARAANQVMRFEVNARCRELLKHAADEERRDVMEFPAEHRMLAAPVMGLGLSMTAMFWLLEYRPQRPMEMLALTSAALVIARRIRGCSLLWLRRELAAGCPQMDSMDVRVLQKLREAGRPLSRRQIRRSFHCLRSPELNDVLVRLQGMGLVHDQAGKVAAV